MEASLDNKTYDESRLITIKVPARHLSYYINATPFERVSGQIEMNGVLYEYVEKRFFNDSLEYKCMPNYSATGLQTAKNDFFKQINGFQHFGNGKKPASRPARSFYPFNDFYLAAGRPATTDTGFSFSRKTSRFFAAIPLVFLAPGEQPPDIYPC
jgi:hypothetical protein